MHSRAMKLAHVFGYPIMKFYSLVPGLPNCRRILGLSMDEGRTAQPRLVEKCHVFENPFSNNELGRTS